MRQCIPCPRHFCCSGDFVVTNIWVGHAPGMPGTFSPPPRVSDPDMHHGTCVTHVPWCMPGSLTSGFLWSQWQEKRFRHSRRMRNSLTRNDATINKPLGRRPRLMVLSWTKVTWSINLLDGILRMARRYHSISTSVRFVNYENIINIIIVVIIVRVNTMITIMKITIMIIMRVGMNFGLHTSNPPNFI